MYGHSNVADVLNVDIPKPGVGQVLIEVFASSINPVDSGVREGRMQRALSLELPLTLGCDVAGIVRQTGPGVKHFKPGDPVYGQASVWHGGSGAFAEYATAPATMLALMPETLSFIEAASLALTGTSALEAVQEHVRLQPAQKILIHGGAGGIGSVAIQLANHIGAYVITTATDRGVAYARNLGADQVIDYRRQAFDDAVRDCDAVIDTVGSDTCVRSYAVCKRGGMLVSMVEQPRTDLMKKYSVKAVYLRTEVSTPWLDRLTKLVDQGVVTPHIEQTYSLAEIRRAFEAKEKGHVQGKIAIQVRDALHPNEI